MKNPLAMQVQFLGQEDPLEKGSLPTQVFLDLSGGSDSKESACLGGDFGLIPGLGDLLEEGMAPHSNILAWRIPWTEEPGGLQSMASQSWTQLSD